MLLILKEEESKVIQNSRITSDIMTFAQCNCIDEKTNQVESWQCDDLLLAVVNQSFVGEKVGRFANAED